MRDRVGYETASRPSIKWASVFVSAPSTKHPQPPLRRHKCEA